MKRPLHITGTTIKLSAFIITKNEEGRITKAINSLKKIADEIIVVDSGSTDNTVNIAKSLGAEIIFNEWHGYVKQKAFAESLCKNDWILNIDADEELSEELQKEIQIILESGNINRYFAYSINVVILHRKDVMPRYFAPFNKCIRLYNKNYCSFANTIKMTTHDDVKFNPDVISVGKICNLKCAAYHRSGISIEQLVTKANFYSGQQALDMVASGRKPLKIRIVFELILWFFKIFIIRRYFVFGFDGFVDSVILAFAKFMKLAKARELYNKKKNNN